MVVIATGILVPISIVLYKVTNTPYTPLIDVIRGTLITNDDLVTRYSRRRPALSTLQRRNSAVTRAVVRLI